MVDENRPPSLVVIGASAGGIEALSMLVSTLPEDFPAPIVIAQHIDPQRASHLAEILGHRSRLPTQTILDDEKLDAGHIYAVPADRHVAIIDGHLTLRSDLKDRPIPSINLLFETAALAYGEGLIAVILTGTGSDGAAGAVDVKRAGGTVIIQNPATAQYPSMPRSLPPGIVDFVANIEEIGGLLSALLVHGADLGEPTETRELQALLQHVYARSGLDFTAYKAPTIQRRLHRRMVATKTNSYSAYRRYLLRHTEEYNRLISSFLIKVTEFFRDSALFDVLREQILPELIAEARHRGPYEGSSLGELRLWSAGCATGEEAYSLAILVADLLGDELDQFTVRIFATDLDADAVAFARRGVYTASQVASVPPDMIRRFFDHVDGEYIIHKRVRSLVIFGEHDLAQRAPFPRIDLVFCRNVLIYFTVELQKRVLQLFAFSLRDGGYLVLGKTESTNPLPEFFMPAQPALKIYRRYGERLLIPSLPSHIGQEAGNFEAVGISERAPVQTSPPARPGMPQRVYGGLRMPVTSLPKPPVRTSMENLGTLIFNLPVGVVVVNRRYDVESINRAAYDLLGIERSALGEDLIHLADQVDSRTLRQIIDGTLRSAPDVPVEGTVKFESALGKTRYLNITGYAHRTEDNADVAADAFLMVTEALAPESNNEAALPDATAVVEPSSDSDTTGVTASSVAAESAAGTDIVRSLRAQVQQLEQQALRLAESNHSLHEANRELTSANLDLHRSNEEYLVNAEEAQAAAEEVETLNEELQATNEELETLNEELQATVEELNATNDDLEARSAELQDLAREQENMRRSSEEEGVRLSTILESMSDALLVVDPGGNTVLTNRAYEELVRSGLESAQWSDESGVVVAAGAQPRRRAARGETFTLVCVLPEAQGPGQRLEANGQPININGETRGGVVLFRNITDLSLRHLQDEFLAMASHELRTPLTPAKAAIQALVKNVESATDQAAVQRWAEIALRQVNRLEVLTSDLMDASRSENGRLELQLQPVLLNEVVAHVVESARLFAPNQPIIVSMPEQPLWVDGDPPRIEQIVFNLLTNAVKYAPNSPQIDVRLSQVQNWAELQVQDTGPGIAAEKLPYLFARFYQARHGTSQARSGLGLGLFLTKELVTAQGGTIDVDSQEGVGTTFTVRLPLRTSSG